MRQRGLHVGIWLGIAFGTLLLVGCAGGGEKQSAPRVVEIYLDRSAGGRANELYGFSSERSGLLDLQQLLRLAAEDVQTLGVVLRADGGGLSLAEAQSLARSVQAFRATGKPVIVYSDYYDNATYLLAAHADRVLLSPLGTVDLIGLRAEVLFFKETLDKLGIQAELVQAGAYKSAAEPYTRTRLSPEAEAMLNRLLDELFDQLVEGIALARGRGREEVIRWIDGGPYSAQEALERGLVDGLEYPDALPTVSKSLVSASAEPTYIADRVERDGGPGVLELLRELMRTPGEPPSDRETIALIYIQGIIVPGREADPLGLSDWAPAERIVEALEKARRNDAVKAIVLRIDSPGGDALASDLIWNAVQQARREKPVIASMGGVAASGGYYVAMAADRIVAEPATLTGSIGVWGGKFALTGLYRKLGIRQQVLTRGQNATIWSDRPLSDSERERLQALIRNVYDEFLQKASKSRNRSLEEIEAVAQGQVWTGREAVRNGLADEEGDLLRAFELAKESAGYSRSHLFQLWELPPRSSPLEELVESGWLRASLRESGALRRLGSAYRFLEGLRTFFLMPYQLHIR